MYRDKEPLRETRTGQQTLEAAIMPNMSNKENRNEENAERLREEEDITQEVTRMSINETKETNKKNPEVELDDTTHNGIESYVESRLESMQVETHPMHQRQLEKTFQERGSNEEKLKDNLKKEIREDL